MSASYLIPANNIEVEQVIKNSRFITYARKVASPKDAKYELSLIKEVHPDARHHCWAYICGKPGQTTLLSMSDDGEPSGTAGKPMLNVLQHKDVGDILVVVVRYFGGVKLGTGGLVRAYSSSVQQVMEELATEMKVEMCELQFTVAYELEGAIRRFITEKGYTESQTEYTDQVRFTLTLPLESRNEFSNELTELCAGRVVIDD